MKEKYFKMNCAKALKLIGSDSQRKCTIRSRADFKIIFKADRHSEPIKPLAFPAFPTNRTGHFRLWIL
jgi:hypothetical protein